MADRSAPLPAPPSFADMVPCHAMPWELTEYETVRVLVSRYGDGRIGKFLERHLKASPIRIKLDEFGSAAWQLCNGRRPLREIAVAMEKKFGERIQPVEQRVAWYFQDLARKQLVTWANASNPDAPPAR